MRINSAIGVTVTAHYLDIEGLRFTDGGEKEIEWASIRASADLRDDGELGFVWLSGLGKYVKQDGTAGLRDAKMTFSGLRRLPEDWQVRVTRDLQTLAERVTIDGGAAISE